MLKVKAKAKMITAPPKKKVRASSVKEIKNEDFPFKTTTRNASKSPTCSFQNTNPKKGTFPLMLCTISFQSGLQKAKNMKQSPIYLFYEIVMNGSDDTLGDDGDVHYHCLHGAHKVVQSKN